jgi:hypothetical protein
MAARVATGIAVGRNERAATEMEASYFFVCHNLVDRHAVTPPTHTFL